MATSNSVRPLRSWQRNSHPLEFSDAISQINAAVRKGLPTSRVAYEKVSVLMMHWDSDDIGVIPLERELGNVFRVIFRFVVEYYEIEASPLSHNPTQNLQNRLIKFRTDHQGDRNLLIYVYSGHASAGASSFACDIFGSIQPRQPQIDWLQMRVLSDFADGDKLYIFDCCFAATGAVQHQETEYLAASAMELDATQHQQNCLTHRLTELLKRFKGTPTTLASYHSHLLAGMDHPIHRLDRTPVYVPSFSRPAIVLETMPQGGSALRDLQTFNYSPAKVLVTITLQGRATTPNVQEFERFLLSHVPGDVANIKVEAAFESGSQVFLVTMPAAVWALLRDDENINFVAHVKSNNILQTEVPQSTLVQRPKGMENIQPGKK